MTVTCDRDLDIYIHWKILRNAAKVVTGKCKYYDTDTEGSVDLWLK
jgi:hypothetical protein